jgi:hypothetical protein
LVFVTASLSLARADEPAPQTRPPVPEWKATLERTYRLEDGQVLRRIAPPHIPERLVYYRAEHAGQAQAIPEPPDSFVFHVQPDGTFHNWGMTFAGGKLPLDHVLSHVLELQSYEFEGSKALLSIDVEGDYVVRPDAPVEQKLAALTRIVKEASGRLVSFQKREIERDVVVAKGKYAFKPPAAAPNERAVVMYVGDYDRNSGGGGGSGDLPGFLKTLGTRVKVPVIDETEGSKPPEFQWRHQSSAYLEREQPGPAKDRKLRVLLDNIENQTGLKFETARRMVPVWFVTEGPAAG